MPERRYEFVVGFTGWGGNAKEAWDAVVENAGLGEIDHEDADPELVEFECPECESDCIPDANATLDEAEDWWNCQVCGKSWIVTEEGEKEVSNDR